MADPTGTPLALAVTLACVSTGGVLLGVALSQVGETVRNKRRLTAEDNRHEANRLDSLARERRNRIAANYETLAVQLQILTGQLLALDFSLERLTSYEKYEGTEVSSLFDDMKESAYKSSRELAATLDNNDTTIALAKSASDIVEKWFNMLLTTAYIVSYEAQKVFTPGHGIETLQKTREHVSVALALARDIKGVIRSELNPD